MSHTRRPGSGAIFQKENARPHTARVSQNCLRTVTSLPWPVDPQICLQSIIFGIIWDGYFDVTPSFPSVSSEDNSSSQLLSFV
ncbi:hypothetical protein TNCV_782371 [Trichonephila clavipes]|nr:hypothetical protein TNCV_782371 [Trichonephila clavipes]